MKHIFIVNPVSGKGRGEKIVPKIKKYCEENHLDYELRLTSLAKEATLIALEYKKEKNIIYAAGGDGTLNEVLNGVVGTKNKLGIIPCGTGNDFYKIIKNEKNSELPADVGQINDHYFINVASIGIDAEVADNVVIMKKKKMPRSQVYNASILYTFIKYKFKELEFTLNKVKKKSKFTLVAICNGCYYGNGYKIAPYAEVNDGLFDIYFADEISKMKIPGLLLKLKKGTHGESPDVHRRKASSIVLESKEPIICNIDGEIIKEKKFKVKLLKSGITIYNNQKLIKALLNDI